mgnify:FL=1
MKRKQLFSFLVDLLFYIAGGIIYSVAVLLFLTENEISPGGLTGIATILNYLFSLPIGTVVFILNIPLLAAGFIKFGGVFIAKTAVATAVMSLTLDISGLFMPKMKIDPILAALFGGLLMGLGISLFMLRGATTGGTDIIAKLINRKFPHLTVGRLMLAADAAVVGLSALVYKNMESALYAVIAIYASSRVMDLILYGADRGKIIYVITDNAKELSDSIMSLINRGVTLLDVTGAYTGTKRQMLMCTVRRHEVAAVCRLATSCDKNAFIIVGEAGEVLGEGFKRNA